MSRLICWDKAAWLDYTHWQQQDKRTLKRINKIIIDIMRDPFSGIAKPEALKENLSGYWSRRIDEKNRIIYTVTATEIIIISCKSHYD